MFVKVTLGQPLHNHHIHGFNPLLVEESTPTTGGTVGGLRVFRTQGLSHLTGGVKILWSQSLPGLFNACCFPQSGIMQQLRQLIQCNWLLKAVERYRDPRWGGVMPALGQIIPSLHTFESLGVLMRRGGHVPSFISVACRRCQHQFHG